MGAVFGSLLMLGLIIVGLLLIIGRGRLLRLFVARLMSGAISAIGGCAFLLIVVAIGGQLLLKGLTGAGQNEAPEPPRVKVWLSISPPSPIEQGKEVVIAASGSSALRSCSITLKDESGQVLSLPAGPDPVTFHWIPSEPGNYAAILTAQTADGDATAREAVYVVASPFSPPCEEYDPTSLTGLQKFGGDWFEGKKHAGIDLLVGRTDRPEVKAISYGQVKDIRSFGTGWGQVVFIEHYHKGRPVVGIYGHIVPAVGISRGPIPRGREVGYVDPDMYGPDGKSRPHLHFGLYDGSYEELPRTGWGAIAPEQFPGRWLNPVDYIGN